MHAVPGERGLGHALQEQVGTWQSVSLGGTVSSTLCGFLEVHSPISHGPICDPEGKKNISTQSKQLISVLSCLGSFNVIIIPPKALVSVRLISTTAADTIIKAPGFLCSKSYTDKAQKVCFGGKIKHGIFFFSPPLLPASFLTEIRGKLQNVPHAAGNRPTPTGL